MAKLVGLSLSLCIMDVVRGKVKAQDIAFLYTGTAIRCDEDLNMVMDTYCQYYWYEHPEMAKEVVRQLWRNKKIHQPRLLGRKVHNIADRNIWIPIDVFDWTKLKVQEWEA